MFSINQEYADKLFSIIDSVLRESLESLDVSLEDIKNQPNRFQHLIFPDGRQEYCWDGHQIVWLEPLKEPAYGMKIHWLRAKK